ncbi:PDGLE domain-containing protein [Nodosilinea nodulosa]|uniref:PDGLE domain-containing protein n=1 Tax=Nodosilinea nodulosa TaxID=416001 RepID=UPI000302437A|nr:PDGLE domain-containing protein [Nodosilinea nodulosa]
MSSTKTKKNIAFWLTGLGSALLIAAVVSPFASSNPDGLDRVSEDHGFDTKAQADPPSHKLPFYSVFDEYALRGVPSAVATPLAGVIGTLVVFGLAWGTGKLLVRPSGVEGSGLGSESDGADRG